MRPAVARKRRTNHALLAVAIIASAAVIWKASFATFVATTSNPGNAWTTGNLALAVTDGNGADLSGSAVFNAAGLTPGSVIADRCITVAFTGNVTPGSTVRLYASAGSTSAAVNGHSLSSYLSLTVDEGTGATDATCTGFVPAATIFDTTHRSGPTSATVTAGSLMDFTTNAAGYATAVVTTWTPSSAAPNNTRSFRFRVAFPGSAVFPGGGDDTVDSDLMTMTAMTTFTWHVRS